MLYVHANSGEHFYVHILLSAVKGAMSFEDLRTVDGQLLPTSHAACLARGLLEDESDWRQCLQKAAHMASGHQLCNLFVTLLHDCSPSDSLTLWMEFRPNICDDFNMLSNPKTLSLIPLKTKYLTMASTSLITSSMLETSHSEIGQQCPFHRVIGWQQLETN